MKRVESPKRYRPGRQEKAFGAPMDGRGEVDVVAGARELFRLPLETTGLRYGQPALAHASSQGRRHFRQSKVGDDHVLGSDECLIEGVALGLRHE